uniref:Copper transport protein n=1 Tax=Ditylenchus dipsaci TaxID=166011 RepID=A0A915EJR9_9BILA
MIAHNTTHFGFFSSLLHEFFQINTPNRSLPMANVGLLHFSHHEIVLFNFWKVGSTIGLIVSILMIFLIGVLHEAVIVDRIPKAQRLDSTLSSSTSTASGSAFLRHLRRIFNRQRMLQAFLYSIQWTLFFTLVLFVVTFNVWLVAAAILGKSVGYLFFIGSPALEKVERITVGVDNPMLSESRKI